ncbi:Na+/H+ antiporter subunit E [Candidatus Bipolaricaulota bacterium]|nr:Na+/H+ antiporter subunit E [Candidatus Bipolaricaulota bacterium]
MVLGVFILMLVWLALTRTLALPSVIAGLLSSLLVVVFWRTIMPGTTSIHKLLKRPVRLTRFVLTLAKRFAISTLRTTWLILTGGEEGRMMALPIHLKDTLARFILLNSITLTPSTISLLVEDDLLYIHWLQASGGHGDWGEIKESLEARLQSLFEGDRRGDR